MDNRLIKVEHLFLSTLRREGIEWFEEGENMGYISNTFVKIASNEIGKFKVAAKALHREVLEATFYLKKYKKWHEAGIPANAVPAIEFSLQHELDNFLIGRFDFAGGIDGLPIKFLEYNADTCTLMQETAVVQELHYLQENNKLKREPIFQLIDALAKRLSHIIQKNPDKEPYLLVSTLGYKEDELNAQIVVKAAKIAGFKGVKYETLENITFSADEGIYVEDENGEFLKYDFWYKLIPWEFIAFEEPELMELLTKITLNSLAVIMNPAFSMVMNCKSIAKYMHELFPKNPFLLKTGFSQSDFPKGYYVQKPIFGRLGENVRFFEGNLSPTEETEGDYGHHSSVYQEIADFNIDVEGYRYQPSIYYLGIPDCICIRRQDDLIIDDDAEFVGHTVM